jgi:hypothetical protein
MPLMTHARLSESLPGSWRLDSRIDVTAAGKRRPEPLLGEDPVALLVYDGAGNFAAQFMRRDRSRSQGLGFDAYFGTYSVDDATGEVTQRLAGALAPEMVGAVLTRTMEIDGDQLAIRLPATHPDGVAVSRMLLWTRVG